MADKKKYDGDDGSPIADMSGVERRNLFTFRIPGAEKKKEREEGKTPPPSLTREERRWYILGALKSALMIGAAFIFGIGLFILILCLIW